MRLHEIVSSNGATHSRKRLGRGEGSGLGKTSGRGHKGQRSRSGGNVRPGFESGHIPLYRKLPKRGFSNFKFRTTFAVVNLVDLERIKDTDTIDRKTLEEAGLVDSGDRYIKILGDGEIERALNITADKFSASAKEKIEKAGGSIVLTGAIPEKKPAKKEETKAEEKGSAKKSKKKK